MSRPRTRIPPVQLILESGVGYKHCLLSVILNDDECVTHRIAIPQIYNEYIVRLFYLSVKYCVNMFHEILLFLAR